MTRPIHILLAIPIAIALAGCDQEPNKLVEITGGNPHKGKAAIDAYGCGSCHTIPGIRTAKGTVGPPLFFWSKRTYIAGQVPNKPDFLIRWIEAPQTIEPGTAMPNLGVSEGTARDIAAYLYTLR